MPDKSPCGLSTAKKPCLDGAADGMTVAAKEDGKDNVEQLNDPETDANQENKKACDLKNIASKEVMSSKVQDQNITLQ